MLEFNNFKEIKPYYDKKTNTYLFEEDVAFNFNLTVESHIIAYNIKANNIFARNITAGNIDASDINAHNITARNIIAWDNINANDILYYAVCCAYENIKCKSIKGCRENAKHFCLDGKITIVDTKRIKEIEKQIADLQEQLKILKG